RAVRNGMSRGEGDTMAASTLTMLRERVHGDVVMPGDVDYEDARHVYNFMIDKHPAAVVRCTDASDVQAVVNQASESGRGVAVRGGGPSGPGLGTAGDATRGGLSAINPGEGDAEGANAPVRRGGTWGKMDEGTDAHRLP